MHAIQTEINNTLDITLSLATTNYDLINSVIELSVLFRRLGKFIRLSSLSDKDGTLWNEFENNGTAIVQVSIVLSLTSVGDLFITE